MADFKGMAEALIAGNAGKVKELVQEAIDELNFLGERGRKLAELARFISVRRF